MARYDFVHASGNLKTTHSKMRRYSPKKITSDVVCATASRDPRTYKWE